MLYFINVSFILQQNEEKHELKLNFEHFICYFKKYEFNILKY
jgi:hypothetical protein